LKKTIYDIIKELGVRDKSKPYKIKNVGFEKLKNSELKYQLQICGKERYNKRKHYSIRELGFKTIYKLTTKGNKRWEKYFKDGGKVFIKSYSTREPMIDRVLFQKKIKEYIGKDVPLPKKEKSPKRKYVKGGVGGKVFGFDFYPQDGKLYPKQRKILLTNSEDYIQQIIDEQNRYKGGNIENVDIVTLTHLDSSLTDLENIETWNNFFQKYGMRFPEFEDKWMKLNGVNQKQTGEDLFNEEEYELMKKKREEIRNLFDRNKKLDF